MGFPSKLVDMNCYGEGDSWKGEVPELTIPKLALKTEEYRGGGMLGPVIIDQGIDKIEFEFKAGGMFLSPLQQFGATTVDAAQLRFVGGYRNQGTGVVDYVEVVARGRYTEVDFGSQKVGDDTETTYKMACAYYKLIRNNTVILEIDLLAGIFVVFGVDRYAEIRAIIGD
ncbi:phage major tail tube protein [Sphingomonas sp. IC081]|uniref:phage major tail tube protein n=1 Tax=Sphingomonas sp. IC081 TaxID=304378 RepID=UPI0011581645|nr:phage major tail tube protein [Sphingomonas sp. IC081]QDK34531.1 phage major tail tube protein [Sphingomonas sp. IC081]